MKHELPTLAYSYDALEPYIDRRTMELHYTKHHADYVSKLNKSLETYPELQALPLRKLLDSIDRVPPVIRGSIRRNGGGHFNHSLFWTCLTPNRKSGVPQGEIESAIINYFGGFTTFQANFEKAANQHFASGWAWLCVSRDGRLVIETLPDHAYPMLHNLEPLLVLDLWEHAYYLKYENKRKEYVSAYWNVVNWEQVNERFLKIKGRVAMTA